MTGKLRPGPPASPKDAARAHARLTLLRTELPRARATAQAWRNGVAVLMMGILGFGLVRGRTDVGMLAAPWHVLAGSLLLLALACGLASAFFLLRAGNGRVVPTPIRELTVGPAAEHREAMLALADLRRGLVVGAISLGLLVVSVSVTWYGPDAKGPFVIVVTDSGMLCGRSVVVVGATVAIDTGTTTMSVPISSVRSIGTATRCP